MLLCADDSGVRLFPAGTEIEVGVPLRWSEHRFLSGLIVRSRRWQTWNR